METLDHTNLVYALKFGIIDWFQYFELIRKLEENKNKAVVK